MSVQTIRRANAPLPPRPATVRRLRLLPAPRPDRPAARRGLFALLLVAVLLAGLVGLLVLNTVLAQQAFRLHDLQRQQSVLDDTERQLTAQADALTAPAALAVKAAALGMVPSCDPGFVALSSAGSVSGTIVGTRTRITGTRHGSLLVVGPPADPAAAPPAVCPGTPAAEVAALAQRAAAEAAAAAPAPAQAAAPAPAHAAAPAATP